MNDQRDKAEQQLPSWLFRIIPLVSMILSAVALAFAWARYNQSDSISWDHWVRIILIGLIGVAFLLAAIVSVFNKNAGWTLFTGSIGLIPVLLLLQLVLLAIRAVRAILGLIAEGNIPKPIQMFIDNYPSKIDIIILSVLAVLIILGIARKLNKKR